MRSLPALNDEQWLKLLEQVAETFNEVTLSRGFNYFKQQFVTSLSISEDQAIRGKVTGSENYTVTLRLDKFRSSSCTCPVGTYCKHLAAVIMELADRLGYPASQIVNAKHHLKRNAAISPPKSVLDELPGMDVFKWHAFMEQATAHVKPAFDQKMYTDALRYPLQNIRKGSIPFSAIDEVFFELHQELFILRKIKGQSAQGGVTYYTSFALYRMYDDIHAWLRQKAGLFKFPSSEARLKQTLEYSRRQMAEETGNKFLDFGLYTALWKYWIAPHPEAGLWAAQEIEELERLTTDSLSASLSAAKAFLYLHQSRSSEAWAALEKGGMLQNAPGSLILSLLGRISDSQDWETLTDWLIRTAAFFNGKKKNELEAYMRFWNDAVSHIPDAEKPMWSVLEGLLPHSSVIIEDMLYERRKWKPWLEMQILQELDPLYHRVGVLQPIEKEAPELLLPYYHQAIQHYVALKNRHAYKSAVKLLKRLEKVYKKMKQSERWDRFFIDFADRHSRLRALHEELKKGKLLE
ncbi:SWIM zinc finger domain-containing protein [Paenibacillus sp. MBLB4367]|uniref:SWIM zinc finger family protein n=1 Tax=Paenibacillus sp. MBLB4367 TaxID=3384767 RepID=UPI0039080D28